MDGSSNKNGSGAGLMLIGPEKHRISSALRFDFRASNNKEEYEALLAGLRLAKELKAKAIDIHNDSLLVVNQISGEFHA